MMKVAASLALLLGSSDAAKNMNGEHRRRLANTLALGSQWGEEGWGEGGRLRCLVLVHALSHLERVDARIGQYAVTSKGDVDTDWNSDYASKGYEYFDVWAPEIATHYGEVFCTPAPVGPHGARALL